MDSACLVFFSLCKCCLPLSRKLKSKGKYEVRSGGDGETEWGGWVGGEGPLGAGGMLDLGERAGGKRICQ